MAKLTTRDLDEMIDRPEWRKFGYIGARDVFKDAILTQGHSGPRAKLLTRADAMVLDRANDLGYTEDQLFDWANSKRGKAYGDCWFHDGGKHAMKYLPRSM